MNAKDKITSGRKAEDKSEPEIENVTTAMASLSNDRDKEVNSEGKVDEETETEEHFIFTPQHVLEKDYFEHGHGKITTDEKSQLPFNHYKQSELRHYSEERDGQDRSVNDLTPYNLENDSKAMSPMQTRFASNAVMFHRMEVAQEEDKKKMSRSNSFDFRPQVVEDKNHFAHPHVHSNTPAEEHEHMRNSSENLSFSHNQAPSMEENFSHYCQSGLKHYSHDARNLHESTEEVQGSFEVETAGPRAAADVVDHSLRGTAAYNLEQHYSRIARAAGNSDVAQNLRDGEIQRESNCNEFNANDLHQRSSVQTIHSADVYSAEARELSASIERKHRSRSGSRERTEYGRRTSDNDFGSSVVSSDGYYDGHSPKTKRGSNSDEFASYDLEQRVSRQKSRDVPAAGLSSHSADVYSDEARERSAAIERRHRSRSGSRDSLNEHERPTSDEKVVKNEYIGTGSQEDHRRHPNVPVEDICQCKNQAGGEVVHFNHCRYYAEPADARNLHDHFQDAEDSGEQNNGCTDGKVLIDNETLQDYDRRHISSANHPLTSFKNMKH